MLAGELFAPFLLSRYSQDQSSEEFIGEWAEQRGIRDQLVIATKVRIINYWSGGVLILVQVLHKLHAWGNRDQAKDVVCRKQCKVDAYQR